MDNTKQNSENNTQTETANEVVTPTAEQIKISELEAKVNDTNDKYLRLYSEFDNFRKRTAKERTELIKSAGEDVFRSILPVIDDFERALKSAHTGIDVRSAFGEGIDLIYNKMQSTLRSKGLETMQSSIGHPFNTDLHEAITNVPAPSENLKGKVVDELEKGYLLNGKVIRFAKVVIGS